MSKATVYLAGKMTGLSQKDMIRWRNASRQHLEDNGFKVLCPASLPLDIDNVTDREIVHSNKYQIRHSDIILAELAYKEISIGTVSEIIFAGTMDKPVIVWGEAYNIVDYPWIKEHTTKHFKTLNKALEYICLNYSK